MWWAEIRTTTIMHSNVSKHSSENDDDRAVFATNSLRCRHLLYRTIKSVSQPQEEATSIENTKRSNEADADDVHALFEITQSEAVGWGVPPTGC